MLLLLAGCARVECANSDPSCDLFTTLLYSSAACALSQEQVIQPLNAARVQSELPARAAAGSRDAASASSFASGLTGGAKWSGGALAPNGMIYGIPDTNDRVLVIDPQSNGTWCSALTQSGYWNKY